MTPFGPLGSMFLLIASSTQCPAANPSAPSGVPAAQSMSCPRPADKDGAPLYQFETGAFVARKLDEDGAWFIEITPARAKGNLTVRVTEEVYKAVASLERGRKVTLFGYVKYAASGAEPPYSCVEF
jgi:hypothetical protein